MHSMGVSINHTQVIRVSRSFSNLSLKVFPNPSTGSLILSSEIVFPRGSQLKVFDLLGQLHLVENLGSGKRQQFIDISSLPNGIYLLQIVVDEKQIKSYKILKQ